MKWVTMLVILCAALAPVSGGAIVEESGINVFEGDSIEITEDDPVTPSTPLLTEFTPLDSRALGGGNNGGESFEEEGILTRKIEEGVEEEEEFEAFVPTTPTSPPLPQYSFEVPTRFVPITTTSRTESTPPAQASRVTATPKPEELPSTTERNLTTVDDTVEVKAQAYTIFQQMFGLSNGTGKLAPEGPAPEFMIDLYNTVTDSYGVTRAKNPYSADVVRAVMERRERAITLNDYFYFNLSDLESGESLLEAELHIHRQPTPHDQLHPSLYLTPFYILSLYQVLDPNPKYLAIPDLHKLLGVHYVPALGSGWEVFNVTQVVTQWLDGGRNSGFLVAATSLGGDQVPVKFSRRWDVDPLHTNSSKQPILVLFTKDSKYKLPDKAPAVPVIKPRTTPKPVTDSTGDDREVTNSLPDDDADRHVPMSSLENPRFHHALLFKDSIRHPNSVGRFRSRRSKNHTDKATGPRLGRLTMQKSCGKSDLFVTLEALGWSSWIISPRSYNAFYCEGMCSFPLNPAMNPTNHATIQSIVHKLNMSPGLTSPCCVPTSLLPISLLYYQDSDSIVLKQYADMVAEACGCL